MSRIREAAVIVGVGAALMMSAAACGGSDKKTSSTTTIGSTAAPGATSSSAPTSVATSPSVSATVAPGNGFVQESESGALRIGLKGTRVLALQAKLKALGFDPGAVDGLFGSNTQTAVKGFQTAKALQADGIAGPLTLAAIDAACQQATCPAG